MAIRRTTAAEDATITALAGLPTGPDTLPYFTGTDTANQSTLTPVGRNLLNKAVEADVRSYLSAAKSGVNSDITRLTGLTGPTTLGGDAIGAYDAVTLRQLQANAGGGGATMNGVMNNHIGAIEWFPGTRAKLPAGCIAADGQLENRIGTSSDLWAAINSGMYVSVSDADWLASPGSPSWPQKAYLRASYSLGDGSTTFRVPDLNGIQPNSIHGLFLRGAGNTGQTGYSPGSTGTVRASASPNITGSTNTSIITGFALESPQRGLGAMVLQDTVLIPASKWATTGSAVTYFPAIAIDASRSDLSYGRDATAEVRPNSAVGIWIIRASGAFTAAGTNFSVLNGDATAPSNGVLAAGGSLKSSYQIGGVNKYAAELSSYGTIGEATPNGAQIVVSKDGVTQSTFKFGADGSLALPTPLGLGSGGTGAIDALTGLRNLGGMPFSRTPLTTSINLDTLDGFNNEGFYYQNQDAYATAANNYPAVLAGILVVTRGAWGGQQEYTTRTGVKYVRGTINTFTGNGPWSAWTRFLKAEGDTMLSKLNINADGEGVALKAITAGFASYIIARDADNSNLWYLGKGGTGSDNVAFNNYKGSAGINLVSDGTINLNTGGSNKTILANGFLTANNRITVANINEAFRLVSASGSASYIMAATDDTGAVASRRWYVGNAGSDNTVGLYNSKTSGAVAIGSTGTASITAKSDGTGSGTSYTTAFNNNGTIVGPLGTVTQTASDARLKSDIQPAKPGALERINAIGCVDFTWDCDQRQDRGFIAQQIAGIDELYTYKPEEDSYLNYSMNALMADSFGAIQELTRKNEHLQSQIDELKALVQSMLE